MTERSLERARVPSWAASRTLCARASSRVGCPIAPWFLLQLPCVPEVASACLQVAQARSL